MLYLLTTHYVLLTTQARRYVLYSLLTTYYLLLTTQARRYVLYLLTTHYVLLSTQARRYVLYLSVGALARPFVIFELVIALQLGKPIVFVHRERGVGGFAEARSPEEQQRQQGLQQQRQQRQLQRRYSRPAKAEETAPLLGSATVVAAGAAAVGEAGAGAAVEEVEVELGAADDGDELDGGAPRGTCVLPHAELHALRKGRPGHATNPHAPSP